MRNIIDLIARNAVEEASAGIIHDGNDGALLYASWTDGGMSFLLDREAFKELADQVEQVRLTFAAAEVE